VKRHSVFLREGCILPDRLDPLREPIGDKWSLVEEIPAPVFDTMIRHAGWHFMWIQGSCSRRGFGKTQEAATGKGLARALSGVAKQCNAAELDSVFVRKYLGFHIATVTLQPRRIQEHTSFDVADIRHPRVVPAG